MLLRRKLMRFYTFDAVQKALKKAEKYGYLNDQEFAKKFIELRKTSKSRQEVSAGLYERGLRNFEELLESLYPQKDEVAVARAWLHKRHSIVPDLRESTDDEPRDSLDWQLKRKLYQSLSRRGFSYETIGKVLDDFFE